MKIYIVALAILATILTACAAPTPAPTAIPIPSVTATATAITTNTPQPTATNSPTNTELPPTPTATPKPLPTATRDISALQAQFMAVTADFLKGTTGIQKINTVRGNNGTLEIEVVSDFSSDDVLTSISSDITQKLSESFVTVNPDHLAGLCGGTAFALDLTVIESIGIKKVKSVTDFATMQKLASLSLTQSEWIKISGLKVIQK